MSTVLLVSYSGIFGGAERIFLDWSTALEGELCLACPEGALARAARTAGLRVFPLRSRRLEVRARVRDRLLAAPRLAGHAQEVRALAADLDPDLVVACGMRSAIALLLGPRPAAPVVFQHNDLLPGSIPGWAARTAAGRADLVITLSHAAAKEIGGSIPVVVLHPGVDVDSFPASGEPTQPPEVVVLGALVPWKRPDLALEAGALARRSRPDLRVRFVGAPLDANGTGLLDQLRQRAAQPDLAGAVEFCGPLADPRPALKRATCLLHCAPREPFGLAVLEALAAGRPAVVPDAAGPAEIVDESCGILYRPGDPAAAADALVALLRDPRRAHLMGERGRLRARAEFDRTAARERFVATVGRVRRRRPSRWFRPDRLTLVTVTHNSASDLEALLRSVEFRIPGAHVVVVDCASSDETVSVAERPREGVIVELVALSENVGFARGCNIALQHVKGPVTVLVNPDVELLDDSLLALAAEVLRSDRPERLLAPVVLRGDGSRQDSVHPAPTSLADLTRALIPPAMMPGRLGVRLAPWRGRLPRRVGWAVGCALVARTGTLRRLGPFDESFFLYGEDLDLGLAAAASGVQTWLWPEGRVLHHGAHSSRTAFGGEPFELLARARHQAISRQLGQRAARVDDAAQAITFASRIALKRAIGRDVARERRQLDAVRSVRREAGTSPLSQR